MFILIKREYKIDRSQPDSLSDPDGYEAGNIYLTNHINFALKKSIVRCQARSAASLSNRGVVLL